MRTPSCTARSPRSASASRRCAVNGSARRTSRSPSSRWMPAASSCSERQRRARACGHAVGAGSVAAMTDATGSAARPGRTLLGEFTGLVLLAVFLPVLVLAGVLLWQASMSVQAQSATRLAATATSSARELEGFLQIHLAAMQVLADRRSSDGDIADIGRWQNDLARVNRHYPAFARLVVTDARGQVSTSMPLMPDNGRPASVADREYFQVPRQTGRGHISNAFLGRGPGNATLVAVSVPLLADGRFAGVVEGSVLVESLFPKRGADEQGLELLLLDRAHTVVHASQGVSKRPLDVL